MSTVEQRFYKLVDIMSKLRSRDGCPWDREQTHQTLRQHLLEETYEVLEAIDREDMEELKEELGDLLLQVIFHAQMAAEENNFTIDDVIDAINEKLVRRHPHVFGNEVVNSASEQIVKWEQSKLKEGKKSAIDGVPKQLPALVRAYRMQNKAATVGFDWPDIEPVWEKLEEELDELKQAIQASDKDQIEDEMGDVLFSMVNIARFLHIHPEDALRGTIEKFDRRFRKIEHTFKVQKRSLNDATLEEMDKVWNDIKTKEKGDVSKVIK